jgi:hypothetical protein
MQVRFNAPLLGPHDEADDEMADALKRAMLLLVCGNRVSLSLTVVL